jgi:hypothetical protein
LKNLAGQPENQSKITEMTALLQKEMMAHADTFPLTVANPEPAEWLPSASGAGKKKPGKKAKP